MGIEIVHEFYKKQIAYYRSVNKVVNGSVYRNSSNISNSVFKYGGGMSSVWRCDFLCEIASKIKNYKEAYSQLFVH